LKHVLVDHADVGEGSSDDIAAVNVIGRGSAGGKAVAAVEVVAVGVQKHFLESFLIREMILNLIYF